MSPANNPIFISQKILKKFIGGNNDYYSKVFIFPLENGFYPNTLELQDLPMEVLKLLPKEKRRGTYDYTDIETNGLNSLNSDLARKYRK